jgi:hypothetical protein
MNGYARVNPEGSPSMNVLVVSLMRSRLFFAVEFSENLMFLQLDDIASWLYPLFNIIEAFDKTCRSPSPVTFSPFVSMSTISTSHPDALDHCAHLLVCGHGSDYIAFF